MGNDGGVIAVQRRFMRHANVKKDDEKADKAEVLLKKVSTCSLTDEPLQDPIVACELGNLFNKEALIRRMLERTLPEAFSHIRSLKDTIPCRFTPNPSAAESSDHEIRSKYVCPIALVEFNGRVPFVILRRCGCVMSDKALKELNVDTCPVCNEPIGAEDRIKLVPSETEIPAILESLKRRRERLKAEKKKERKAVEGAKTSTGKHQHAGDTTDGKKSSLKRQRSNGEKSQSHKKPALSVADSLVEKTMKEATEAVQKGKEKSKVYSSLFGKKKQEDANALLMTVGGLRYTLR